MRKTFQGNTSQEQEHAHKRCILNNKLQSAGTMKRRMI